MGLGGLLRALLLPVLLALFLQPLALFNAHPPLAAIHPGDAQLCDQNATHFHNALGEEHAEEQGRPAHKHEPTKHLHDPPIGQDALVFLTIPACHATWQNPTMLAAVARRPSGLYRPPRQA